MLFLLYIAYNMNKFHLYPLLLILCFNLVSNHSSAQDVVDLHQLKSGRFLQDSSPIYELPFLENKRVLLIQGYRTIFSHKNQCASDFKVPSGSKIFAARAGIVLKTKEDSKIGGLGRKFLSKGNHIIIMHDDSTCAAYWHLKYKGVEKNIGDTIQLGDLIGYSGNTGFSAFPHLHFEVFKLNDGRKVSLPARFKTSKGIIYLKPLRKYRKPK